MTGCISTESRQRDITLKNSHCKSFFLQSLSLTELTKNV